MKEIEEFIEAIKVVSSNDPDVDKIEFYWDKAADLLNQLSSTLPVSQFFNLSEAFSDNKSYEYYDLDGLYIEAIEKMESYPPYQLFADTSKIEIVYKLRVRCWETLSLDEFAGSSSIPTFTEVYTKFLLSEEEDFTILVTEKVLDSCNIHELRLLLEVFIIFKDSWDIDWVIKQIVLRLDYVPSTGQIK